uniref:Uncharacterized protein n=1 Tax=Pyxicephalus adspersus TaxID=30357 RepID=A0AAV3A6X0_PYXAD|nr:TPA: hypothetical protein GDO54_015861 [Pyxicephalus adspersus]
MPYGVTTLEGMPYGETTLEGLPYGETTLEGLPYGETTLEGLPYGETTLESLPYGETTLGGLPYGLTALESLKYGPTVMKTWHMDSEKRTPLHAAAFLGDAEIIELLILSGARVNAKDNMWLTPLHRAVASRSEVSVILHISYHV